MALPSSGPLSLGQIATELGVSHSNVSLRSLSATAGFSIPDSISKFYGYSHVVIDICGSSSAGNASGFITSSEEVNITLTVFFTVYDDMGGQYDQTAQIFNGSANGSWFVEFTNFLANLSYVQITGISPDNSGGQNYSMGDFVGSC